MKEEIKPTILFNVKNFAERIRKAGFKTGPSMDATLGELGDELDRLEADVEATTEAIGLMRSLIGAQQAYLGCIGTDPLELAAQLISNRKKQN